MKDTVLISGPEMFLDAVERIREGNGRLPWFKGWPNFQVAVEGERYESSMTPRLMAGFVEFHNQLLRTYAEARYGSPSLSRLTALEKAELDLIFEISSGCTEGKGPLDDFFNKLLATLPMNKMSGNHVAALLIISVLSYAGYHVFKEYTIADLEKARMAASQKSAETNAKLMSALIEVLADQSVPPEARRMRERAEEGYRAIVKGAPDATGMEIQGEYYDAQDLQRIRDRDPPTRVRGERVEDLYIEMIRRSEDSLSLTLRLPGEEYTFPGKVDLNVFNQADESRLFNAIRDVTPIRLAHFAVSEHDRIIKSSVLAVSNQDD